MFDATVVGLVGLKLGFLMLSEWYTRSMLPGTITIPQRRKMYVGDAMVVDAGQKNK